MGIFHITLISQLDIARYGTLKVRTFLKQSWPPQSRSGTPEQATQELSVGWPTLGDYSGLANAGAGCSGWGTHRCPDLWWPGDGVRWVGHPRVDQPIAYSVCPTQDDLPLGNSWVAYSEMAYFGVTYYGWTTRGGHPEQATTRV